MWPTCTRCGAGWTASAAGERLTVPAPEEVPLRAVDWLRAVRIVSSRYPPVSVFDRVAAPDDLEATLALEAMTNERLRDEAGDIRLVAPADRVVGPGSTPIMAAFTHPRPSRFSDGSFGVFYCAANARTAIAETRYHRELFLRRGGFDPLDLQMREYLAPLRAEFHDLRARQAEWPELYDRDDYSASQPFGARLRAADSMGIVYDSVRDPEGGWCAGVLRPPAIAGRCTQGRHLVYRWDGERIAHVLAVQEVGQ